MADAKLTALMVVVECLSVGSHTLSKAAMTRGMSNYIFVLYTDIIGLAFLIPCSFLFHRRKSTDRRLTLTFSIFCKICLLAVIRCSMQMFSTIGIRYASPTLAAAMIDTVPAITFMLAVSCRMEKLELRMQRSLAKFLGTMLSIAGALVVTLYKGPPVALHSSSSPPNNSTNFQILGLPPSNWVIGGLFLAIASVCHSFMFIVKTWVIREYPAELTVATISSILTTIQSAMVCLFAERDPNAWKMWLSLELIAIGYSAILQVVRSVVHLRSSRKEGPVYTVMFKPVRMVIAIVLGVSFLGDKLYVGSVIGAAVIALGFYGVIWGKDKEHTVINGFRSGIGTSESFHHKAPLLTHISM